MIPGLRWLVFCIGVVLAAPILPAAEWQPLASWRISEGRVAPWAGADTRIDPSLRGKELRFEASRVVAPHPIGCDGARYEWLFGGAEDLFEGNLPEPREQAAGRVGLTRFPVATLRAGCPNAGFDFHRTPDGALLLGLDNVVWTLRATQAATTPGEIVQALLIEHFTHDMAFTRESLQSKRAYLSASLQARIDAWFARPGSPDEVPAIDGDPFTDSQEYPDRFALGGTRVAASRAMVPVYFRGDWPRRRRVDYLLVRSAGKWLVDDVVDERGESLRGLLVTR